MNRPAVGIGVTMQLAMDIRIASESARFGFVFSRRGIVPEACSTWFLPRVVGISKLARVLHGFARRLQIQERLTAEVAQCIWDELQPKGVAVVIDAQHGCMTGRGVRTPGVGMVTSRLMGCFLEDHRSRKEVLSLMGY